MTISSTSMVMPAAGFSETAPALAEIERRILAAGTRTVLVAPDKELDGAGFLRVIDASAERFAGAIASGTVCALYGDWSAATCAAFFALMKLGAIVAPFTPAVAPHLDQLCGIAGVTR